MKVWVVYEWWNRDEDPPTLRGVFERKDQAEEWVAKVAACVNGWCVEGVEFYPAPACEIIRDAPEVQA